MNDLAAHFQMLARYNRIANEKLYEKCAQLDDAEYRKNRQGSFGNIHALLNHILVGDQIWMARFEGGGASAPRLGEILFDEFPRLRSARGEQDARIEAFFAGPPPGFLERSLRYTNSRGVEYAEETSIAVSHFFNHQTHHRGQVHVMLSQTPITPPWLDLHRIVNP
jgi:uncharacterized damage-inducible protein DinB